MRVLAENLFNKLINLPQFIVSSENKLLKKAVAWKILSLKTKQ